MRLGEKMRTSHQLLIYCLDVPQPLHSFHPRKLQIEHPPFFQPNYNLKFKNFIIRQCLAFSHFIVHGMYNFGPYRTILTIKFTGTFDGKNIFTNQIFQHFLNLW